MSDTAVADDTPDQPSYTVRRSLVGKEVTFRLTDRTLLCPDRPALPFTEIRAVRVYDSPGLRLSGGAEIAPDFARCVVRPTHGRAIVLTSKHCLGLGRFEDRSASFGPFVNALIARVGAANPATVFRAGMPPALWWTWVVILLGVAVVTPLLGLLVVGDIIEQDSFSPAPIMSAIVLFGMFFSLFGFIRMLRRSRSRQFDPRVGTTKN